MRSRMYTVSVLCTLVQYTTILYKQVLYTLEHNMFITKTLKVHTDTADCGLRGIRRCGQRSGSGQ